MPRNAYSECAQRCINLGRRMRATILRADGPLPMLRVAPHCRGARLRRRGLRGSWAKRCHLLRLARRTNRLLGGVHAGTADHIWDDVRRDVSVALYEAVAVDQCGSRCVGMVGSPS